MFFPSMKAKVCFEMMKYLLNENNMFLSVNTTQLNCLKNVHIIIQLYTLIICRCEPSIYDYNESVQ